MSKASQKSNPEAGVFRLAKPLKKGFFRLLFSRFLIILLLLVIQLLIPIFFYGWLRSFLPPSCCGQRH